MDADIRVGDTVRFVHPDDGAFFGVVRLVEGNLLVVAVWLSPTCESLVEVPRAWLTVPF